VYRIGAVEKLKDHPVIIDGREKSWA
jgi:hypothetical protein